MARPKVEPALKHARYLAENGVPLFLAQPAMRGDAWDPSGGRSGTGYRLPARWQLTEADPSVVDAWEPGLALCAVMGHAVDALDVDPRHGGAASAAAIQSEGLWPHTYGRQSSPSGGWHDFIAPLNAPRKIGFRPGLDVLAERSFVFLAPTRKLSKTTGKVDSYRWKTAPDLGELALLGDDSGAWIAQEIRREPDDDGPTYDGPAYDALTTRQREAARAHVDAVIKGWRARLELAADWPEGERDEQGRGWEALARDAAWSLARLAAHPAYPLAEADAERTYRELLGPLADDPRCGDKWSEQLLAKAAAQPCETPTWPSAPGDDFEALDDGEASPDAFERDVLKELSLLRVREEARRRHETLRRAEFAAPMPPVVRLDDFLVVEDEERAYRIDGLWPVGGRILLAAPDKGGKTTLMGNLVRCLVDGDALYDRFPVEPVRRVVLIDDEMGERQLRLWLRKQGIRNTEAVDVVELQGSLSSFDVLTPEVRQMWAERFRGADVLILDCLRPVLDALALDENHDAGRFLVALEELMRSAGISEALVVQHTGHQGERARGDSRLLGWPTAKWLLVKERDDQGNDLDHGRRFFSAFGRDVDVPESETALNAENLHLSIVGGNRARARRNAVQEAVMAAVVATPGIQSNALVAELGRNRDVVTAAVRSLELEGRVRVEPGPRGARLHYPAEPEQEDFDDVS